MSHFKAKIKHIMETLDFGNTMYRGIMALALGIVLIIYPTKTQHMLVNTMGYFWLGSGFALIRRPHTEQLMGKPVSRGIGLIAMITGLLVVSRDITRWWVPEIIVVELLGVAIAITGVVHIFEQYKLGKVFRKKEDTLDFMLGFYEIFLGLVLISSPLRHGPVTYWVATIWALIFGNLVIANGFAQRAAKAKETEASAPQDRLESVPANDEK